MQPPHPVTVLPPFYISPADRRCVPPLPRPDVAPRTGSTPTVDGGARAHPTTHAMAPGDSSVSRLRSAFIAAPLPIVTHQQRSLALRVAIRRIPCQSNPARRRARFVATASTPTPKPRDTPDEDTSSASGGVLNSSSTSEIVRPNWAPPWLPTFFLTLKDRPWLQLCIMMPLYLVHLFVFSTKGWKWEQPLIPNDKNLFQSLGLDSVMGALVSVGFLVVRKFVLKVDKRQPPEPLIPSLLKHDNPPWKVPREAKKRIASTTALLVVAFLASGYFAVIIEQILYLAAGYGVPLTVATTRAWKVLLGHLMWVFMGIKILRRLRPFFPDKGTWLRWKWKENWLWWAIGGYYVSALLFNIADVVNQLVLPASMFEEETVVSKLINPENRDPAAMAIGSIGPCVSAPVFEEVLYRGFLLPALGCFLPMWAAIPASSVLFALHHLNPTGVLPLSVLGLIWAILYTRSRNLTVTILIHAMWNSRVFLSSFLGLRTYTDFE